jgi:hypothetical protein
VAQNFLNTTTHTVAWFAKRAQENELQLRAPFQRNPVWTNKQKAFLIDTILRGYPVPELYMQEYADAQGDSQYVVVDGQQRLRACLEFIDGRFAFDAEDSPDLAGMTFANLNETQKKALFGYNFVVRVLPEMPEVELRAMFARLNRNVVALNAQELRHATYWGEFISTMELISDDERWPVIGVFTPNDVRRMLDIEYVSELTIGLLHGPQNKKEQLDEWYQAYEEAFPQKDEVKTVFNSVLGEILSIMPDIERSRWRKKSDFYSLFTVLARLESLIPFSREGRQRIRELLLEFAGKVDEYLRDPLRQRADIPVAALEYASAVERAASDLAKRSKREESTCSPTLLHSG